MSSKKAAKQNPKKQHKQALAQQMQEVSTDLQWAQQIFPHIDQYFVDLVGNDVHRRYKGATEYPKHFGARVEINEKHSRFDVMKFVTFNEEGVLAKDGDINEGEYEMGYVHFHTLKQIAEDAHKKQRPVDIGWAYVPHINFDYSVDAALRAAEKHEHFEAAVKAHLGKALVIYNNVVEELKQEYTAENDDGLYIGVCFYYNPETNMLEYVMQKHGVTDLIDGKASERDFRDLPATNGETSPIVVDGDESFRNYASCMLRLVADVAKWERISKPSKARMEAAADDLVGRMISNAESVFDNAKTKAKEDGITAELSMRYNGLRGMLEVVYFDDHNNVCQIDLGMDAAAVLLIMTRIEPDLQLHVTPRFNKAFVERFGSGDRTVISADGTTIATEIKPGLQIIDDLPFIPETASYPRGQTPDLLVVDELGATEEADDEVAADENYALKS